MLSNKFFATTILLCCVFEGGLFKQIPEYINICKWDQNTINACAQKSIEALRPKLISGISEIDVPGIDPFIINQVIPVTGGSNAIRATVKDLKVSGAGNFSIKSLDVDLDTFTIRARVRFPKLHFDGKYKLDVQILALPLNGEGKMTADAVKCDADLVLHALITNKDGVDYIEFDKLDIDIKIKDYKIKLEDLFNGDKLLGDAANNAINQNKEEVIRIAKPYTEKTVSNLLLDFSNKIIKDLTLEQLLPKP